MHGIIFAELKKYVEARLGASAWPALVEKAGLEGMAFIASSNYEDRDAVALVESASAITGMAVPAILEDFGELPI